MTKPGGYWRWWNRERLLCRLEEAVEYGVLSPHDAVESFRREAWQTRWFHRGHFWRAFDRLYNAGYFRIGLDLGLPATVCHRIGPELRATRRRLGRDLTEDDVRAILTVLLATYTYGPT